MPGPSINLGNVFRTFFSGNIMSGGSSTRTQKNERPKTWVEKEIEAQQAKEKENKALLEKQKRVNSRWNDVKSIFGFGEKLTETEAKKLIELESPKRFTEEKTLDKFSDQSIWDE